jgi:A/G-specific adenine glycosylase
MELGAAVCRSRAPRCDVCPVADGCPSRGIAQPVPVPRQPPLHGSDRAYRGALLRALAEAPGNRLGERRARAALGRGADRIGPALDDDGWERVIAGLERDGLLRRTHKSLRLGATTIGT